MEVISKKFEHHGKTINFEVGKMAKQADGAVLISMGGTSVLVTAVASEGERKGQDFLPLTVDVEEKMYAAGKIPGGFFRREGRPGETSILTCRLIDRALRPNFPDWFRNEVQIIATIMSADQDNLPDVLALTGASTALTLSNIPFHGPLAGVRVGRVDGEWVINPTFQDLQESDMNLVVAGNREAIVMVEADAKEAPEELMEEALQVGHEAIKGLVEIQTKIDREYRSIQQEAPKEELMEKYSQELATKCGETVDSLFMALDSNDTERVREAWERIDSMKRESVKGLQPRVRKMVSILVSMKIHSEVFERLAEKIKSFREDIRKIIVDSSMPELSKAQGDNVLRDKRKEISGSLIEKYPDFSPEISEAIKKLEKSLVREQILEQGVRPDGRKPFQIRNITCEVGLLGQTHGSALFTRGETQVLAIVTLGSIGDKQVLDNLGVEEFKRFIHHYNFPPYSSGEARFLRGPKRREIGHGALAERALSNVIPEEEDFPYTIRLVSEVLESNGSTSMASICGSSLALMDAGVPLKKNEAVGGIAMGMVSSGEDFIVLSDIQGAEDAAGDMDFKIAGTRSGITALQMDLKKRGVPQSILSKALKQAREGLNFILKAMNETISAPRKDLSPHAPKMIIIEIPVDKIGSVIGPGGKMIRSLISDYGVSIDIEDDGKVFIGGKDGEMAEAARKHIELMTRVPVVGDEYMGKVVKITTFGAFIEVLPGTDGLLHISKMSKRRVDRVEDVMNTGDRLKVRIGEIDSQDRISLELVDLESPRKEE